MSCTANEIPMATPGVTVLVEMAWCNGQGDFEPGDGYTLALSPPCSSKLPPVTRPGTFQAPNRVLFVTDGTEFTYPGIWEVSVRLDDGRQSKCTGRLSVTQSVCRTNA